MAWADWAVCAPAVESSPAASIRRSEAVTSCLATALALCCCSCCGCWLLAELDDFGCTLQLHELLRCRAATCASALLEFWAERSCCQATRPLLLSEAVWSAAGRAGGAADRHPPHVSANPYSAFCTLRPTSVCFHASQVTSNWRREQRLLQVEACPRSYLRHSSPMFDCAHVTHAGIAALRAGTLTLLTSCSICTHTAASPRASAACLRRTARAGCRCTL